MWNCAAKLRRCCGPMTASGIFWRNPQLEVSQMQTIKEIEIIEPGEACPKNVENTSGARRDVALRSMRFGGDDMSDATVMLAAIHAGDSNAAEALLILVY